MYTSCISNIFISDSFTGSATLSLWWIFKAVQLEGLWFLTLWAYELWQQVWRSNTFFCYHLFPLPMLLICTSFLLFRLCSCFVNVVLQCLSCTRPLVAYLLGKDHSRECMWLCILANEYIHWHQVLSLQLFKCSGSTRHEDWCFLCELQCHIKRASESIHPFSPTNILSHLPNIGGNLGYGRQEDAHEFMRWFTFFAWHGCLSLDCL